jgi:hypothetical protein
MELRIGQVARALYCELFVAMGNLSIPELQAERWYRTSVTYNTNPGICDCDVASDICHSFFFRGLYLHMLKKW